jgi:hypothetical protein
MEIAEPGQADYPNVFEVTYRALVNETGVDKYEVMQKHFIVERAWGNSYRIVL